MYIYVYIYIYIYIYIYSELRFLESHQFHLHSLVFQIRSWNSSTSSYQVLPRWRCNSLIQTWIGGHQPERQQTQQTQQTSRFQDEKNGAEFIRSFNCKLMSKLVTSDFSPQFWNWRSTFLEGRFRPEGQRLWTSSLHVPQTCGKQIGIGLLSPNPVVGVLLYDLWSLVKSCVVKAPVHMEHIPVFIRTSCAYKYIYNIHICMHKPLDWPKFWTQSTVCFPKAIFWPFGAIGMKIFLWTWGHCRNVWVPVDRKTHGCPAKASTKNSGKGSPEPCFLW